MPCDVVRGSGVRPERAIRAAFAFPLVLDCARERVSMPEKTCIGPIMNLLRTGKRIRLKSLASMGKVAASRI